MSGLLVPQHIAEIVEAPHMYAEERRMTKKELEKEIEREEHHPAGNWGMNLEEAELVSPLGPRIQPQRMFKCIP